MVTIFSRALFGQEHNGACGSLAMCCGNLEARSCLSRLTMTTIAVVENQSEVLTLIKDALEVEGFDVLLYHDGSRALDAFESRSPDLVITDIRMPRMDGIELLRRLPQKSNTPVILLTSRADETAELIGLRIGADDLIRKPFSPRVLVERVRMVLRRYRPPAVAGDRQVDDRTIERGHLRMDKERYTCTWKGQESESDSNRVPARLPRTLALAKGLPLPPGLTFASYSGRPSTMYSCNLAYFSPIAKVALVPGAFAQARALSRLSN